MRTGLAGVSRGQEEGREQEGRSGPGSAARLAAQSPSVPEASQALLRAALRIPSLPRGIPEALTQPSAPPPCHGWEGGWGQGRLLRPASQGACLCFSSADLQPDWTFEEPLKGEGVWASGAPRWLRAAGRVSRSCFPRGSSFRSLPPPREVGVKQIPKGFSTKPSECGFFRPLYVHLQNGYTTQPRTTLLV